MTIHRQAGPASTETVMLSAPTSGASTGEDSDDRYEKRGRQRILYWSTGFTVLFLVIVRGLTARPPRGKRVAAARSGVTPIQASSSPHPV